MKRKLKWILPLAALALLAIGLAAYVGQYYPADASAAKALAPDGDVQIAATAYGWHFDGPSDDAALIFYPGGKVEATAYAPLLRELAREGMDACLVEMPLRLAIFGIDRASAVMAAHDYPHWYVGGHSLGGVCAATYASAHADALDGVVLLASYSTKPLDDGLDALLVRGAADGVLNLKQYEANRKNAPADAVEVVIEGGNHAQFGSYGPQKGDGNPAISREEQVQETVRAILGLLHAGEG